MRPGRLSNSADAAAKKHPPRNTTRSTYPNQVSSIARQALHPAIGRYCGLNHFPNKYLFSSVNCSDLEFFLRAEVGEDARLAQSVDKSAAQVDATKSIGDLPLVVVSAGHSFDAFKSLAKNIPFDKANKTWLDLQSDLARLSSNTSQLIDPTATHDINFDDPEIIIKGVRVALSKVRDHDAQEKRARAAN